MLSKALTRFMRVNANLRNRLQKRPMSDKVSIKDPHANDVIIPHEKFEAGYARRQFGNNMVLLGGITFFTLSFGFVYQSGVMVPNLTPPKKNLGE